MTGISCLSCTAQTTNGLALCENCRTSATVRLEWLPVYFRNLARWRPGRAGGRPAGALIWWSARIKYLGNRRPCDIYRDGDYEAMRTLIQRLNALADGAFA